MINFEKVNIFKIEKEMKNEISQGKDLSDERPFTFKITKRRSPWTPEEDEAITALVNKYGTGNWTLIANEMSNVYGFKSRSGKQCRERWHNHLDPCINKDYWTEKEENVLFMKHMEYGNKWSDIAKFLPGRTDNAIKNHFYSKLRKFIRKILKQINKDNLLKTNGIDVNKFNSDRVYKMIKKNKLPYNNLNKESILQMIINYEKNSKANKSEAMLNRKTHRKKTRPKEILSTERIGKRYAGANEEDFDEVYANQEQLRYDDRSKKNRGLAPSSLYKTNINTRSRRLTTKSDNFGNLSRQNIPDTNISYRTTQTRSRRNVKRRHMTDDFIYEHDELDDEKFTRESRQKGFTNAGVHNTRQQLTQYAHHMNSEIPSMNEENGKDLVNRNLNIIINKSVLFKKYVKEEEERLSSKGSSEKTKEKKFKYDTSQSMNKIAIENTNLFQNSIINQQSTSSSNPSIQPIPLLNPLLASTPQANYIMDDRLYRYDNFPYMDPIPLISPITNAKLYPPSTRNYFNIDLLQEGNYTIPVALPGYNIFRANPFNNFNNFVLTPTGIEKVTYTPYTPNKEVSMQNKILINDDNKLDSQQTPQFKQNNSCQPNEAVKKVEDFYDQIKDISDKENTNTKKLKRPSLDLNLVNTSDTGKIFSDSIANSYLSKNVKDTNINLNQQRYQKTPPNEAVLQYDPSSSETLTDEKQAAEDESSGTNLSEKSNIQGLQTNRIKLLKLEGNNLAISPKSAFVKMK